MKQINAMLILHQVKEQKTKSHYYMIARFLYGVLTIVAILVALGLAIYGIRKGPRSTGLAFFISSVLLASSVYTSYRIFRPQPPRKKRP